MKKLLFFTTVTVLLSGSGFLYFTRANDANTENSFQVALVTKGDLENKVSSTGTLAAVNTVAVGTQVSGTIEKILVDYNAKVKKDQLLAVIDTTVAKATVQDAEAGVAQRRAQLAQVKTEYARNQTLFEQGYVAELTLLTSKTAVATAQAVLSSAEATLKKARTTLGYAEIRSPIDGTVIARAIDAGQTVAASLNTPTLFTIAEDLANMQIEAQVDESDIGQIKEGQAVRFTVQAYPDETFTGVVKQIRLQPKTVQDVVNYTVVIDAVNERGLLLPGMTATVNFVVEERKDVLLIPNTAIYFKPPADMLAKADDPSPAKRPDNAGSQGQGQGQGQQQGQGQGQRQRQGQGQGGQGQRTNSGQGTDQAQGGQPTGAKRPDKLTRVFYLAENGTPAVAMFVPGVTDGVMTEIKASRSLSEGVKVITGLNAPGKAKSTTANLPNPFAGGGPRRGF